MKCVPSEFTIKYWSSQHEWWSVVSLNKFNIFYEVELYRFLQYPWSNFQSSVLLLKSCCKTDLFCVVATFKVTLIYCACNSKQVLIKITAYIHNVMASISFICCMVEVQFVDSFWFSCFVVLLWSRDLFQLVAFAAVHSFS